MSFLFVLFLISLPAASSRLLLLSQTQTQSQNGAFVSATATQKEELQRYSQTLRVNQFLIKEEKKMGSRPPRCEHKCYRCQPCEAVQVPTNINGGFNLEYTNYEPEGWKCKCGPTLYTP